jgi:hypothetical protein
MAIANAYLYQTLKASEAEYRRLVENIPKLIFRVDQQGRCLFVNLAVQTTLGWPPLPSWPPPACVRSWGARMTGLQPTWSRC